jgi:hypothetical protein
VAADADLFVCTPPQSIITYYYVTRT